MKGMSVSEESSWDEKAVHMNVCKLNPEVW